jgi:glycosyltransferase involved in cell wall biosynthesis
MVTYNHEHFLADALDSILMQETDFNFEIVVGDDCSTDGTRGILLDYQKRHPDRVRPILHKHNVGMQRNTLATLEACRGEYIALLDGDDYWLSPKKLQSQVETLDSHPEYSMCWHNAYNEYEDGMREDFVTKHDGPKRECVALEEVAFRNFIPTCSVVVRRHVLGDYPSFCLKSPFGDWLINVLAAREGSLAYIDELWAVRRVHPGGVNSMQSQLVTLPATLKCIETVDELLHYKYHRNAVNVMLGLHQRLAWVYYIQGAAKEAGHHAAICLQRRPFTGSLPETWMLSKMVLEGSFPRVYSGLRGVKKAGCRLLRMMSPRKVQ